MNPAQPHIRQLERAWPGVPAEGQSLSSWPTAKPDYRIDPETGCWEWLKFKLRGYGRSNFAGHSQYAHRAYYEVAFGPIPDGQHVHHRCENPACVNPAHLELTVHAVHLAYHKQEESNLSWDDVRAIRAQAWEGVSVQVLAEQWGLSLGTIHPLIVGRTWKDANYSRPAWTRRCLECSSEFTTSRPGKLFCCPQHRSTWNNRERRFRHAA